MEDLWILQIVVQWRVNRKRYAAEAVYACPRNDDDVKSMADCLLRGFVREIMPGFHAEQMTALKVSGERHVLKGPLAARMRRHLSSTLCGDRALWVMATPPEHYYSPTEDNGNG